MSSSEEVREDRIENLERKKGLTYEAQWKKKWKKGGRRVR
jgi:hypothetical protein